MPVFRGSVRATHILDDNKLACDATGVSDERGALVRRQVVEEMAGEDPVELAVAERQSDIPLQHTRVRHTGRGNLDHPSALVKRHQLAAQMLGEEARAASDIEHPCRGQGPHYADELLDLRRPTGSLALRERPRAEPPVVVLARSLVEMRAHLSVRLTLGHLGESTLANVQSGPSAAPRATSAAFRASRHCPRGSTPPVRQLRVVRRLRHAQECCMNRRMPGARAAVGSRCNRQEGET